MLELAHLKTNKYITELTKEIIEFNKGKQEEKIINNIIQENNDRQSIFDKSTNHESNKHRVVNFEGNKKPLRSSTFLPINYINPSKTEKKDLTHSAHYASKPIIKKKRTSISPLKRIEKVTDKTSIINAEVKKIARNLSFSNVEHSEPQNPKKDDDNISVKSNTSTITILDGGSKKLIYSKILNIYKGFESQLEDYLDFVLRSDENCNKRLIHR